VIKKVAEWEYDYSDNFENRQDFDRSVKKGLRIQAFFS